VNINDNRKEEIRTNNREIGMRRDSYWQEADIAKRMNMPITAEMEEQDNVCERVSAYWNRVKKCACCKIHWFKLFNDYYNGLCWYCHRQEFEGEPDIPF